MKKEKMKKMYFISTTYVVREFQVPPKRGNMLGSRKEVFQPHLPVRLPCYDLAPVTSFTLGRFPLARDHVLQVPPAPMA